MAAESLIERLFERFPIEREPVINTMGKKLVIAVASPGWLSTTQNPHIPTTHAGMSRALIDSIEEGASIIHVHSREEGGRPSGTVEDTRKILDPVFTRHPDVITSIHMSPEKGEKGAAAFADYLHRCTANGVRYMHGTPLHTRGSVVEGQMIWGDELLRELIPFLEEQKVKPELLVYDTFGLERSAEAIRAAARWKPYWINLNFGKHHSVPIGHDPWAHYQVTTLVQMARAMLPQETVLGAYIGGRNWLPMTVLAITLGVDIVRVGIEDCLWVYPHRGDIIQRDSDMVRKIAVIARELGREIASPKETRQILGF